MKCEVILRRNDMSGEINEYCFYRTLSLFDTGSLDHSMKFFVCCNNCKDTFTVLQIGI